MVRHHVSGHHGASYFETQSKDIYIYIWLVLWNISYFRIQLGLMIRICHIFQRGRYTSKQFCISSATLIPLISHVPSPQPWERTPELTGANAKEDHGKRGKTESVPANLAVPW